MKQNIFKILEKIPKLVLFTVSLVIVFLLGVTDYLTGTELSFSIFYFLPIMIVSWHLNIKTGIFFSFACAATWFIADLLGEHTYSSNYIFAWNTIMRLCIFLIINIIIHGLRRNSELAAKNKLLAQKSYNIISTSQQITGIIVESITKYNSELRIWAERQKADKKSLPRIIEATCLNIGSNLRALTDICFGKSTLEKNVKLEDFIDSLQEKIEEVNSKISSESKE